MRLCALRKLEEKAIRKEHEDLTEEKAALKTLLRDAGKPPEKGGRVWAAIAEQVQGIKDSFGPDTDIGRRRTELGAPPLDVVVPLEAMVERS